MTSNIMQWNCRGVISKWAEVKPLLIEKAFGVICLQETHFLPNDPYDFSLPNYTLYNEYPDTDRRQGGVSIYVTNTFPHFQVPVDTNFQAVACSVRMGRNSICICSLYLPPNVSFMQSDLNDLVAQLPPPFIICSDANSRHFLWGADRCDSRGNIWEAVIRQHGLRVLNDGSPTRLDEYTGLWSNIDVTVASSSIGQLLQWETDNDLYSSDHLPIYVHLDHDGYVPPSPNFCGWHINKANWTDFAAKCALIFSEREGMGNYKSITDALLRAAAECIPQKSGQSKYSCPWWNNECREAIRSRRRAQNRFRRSHSTAHLLAYKAAKAVARRTIRRAKKESWERLLHMFNATTPMPLLWDIIRKFTKKERYNRPLPVLKVRGTMVDDPTEVANIFGQLFSAMSSSENYRTVFRLRERELTTQLPSFHSTNDEVYNDMFTLDELKQSISRCGNTSIGPDKLHYAFFRFLRDDQLQVILSMINCIWCAEHIPDEWKHSIIIPILKPGKPREKPESYRPIQLTSCFSKLMERMVSQRLNWFLEQNNMLSNFQCAFRKGRNTADHIIRLESDVRRGFFYHKYTVAVFLDLKNAYNLTSKVALLTKMHQLGFRGRLMCFIRSYLDKRTFQVRNGTLSATYEQENGLVQGGVISPILFNIMIDDIFQNVPNDVARALYADDCSLWVQGRRILPLIDKMQTVLNHVSEWTDQWGFVFSPLKCHAIVFRRFMKERELDNLPVLTIYEQPVAYADSVKFLGVILDTRLNLNTMIQHLKAKAVKRISLLKCLSGRGCGADRSILLRIYKSMIRPILDYACHIFDGPRNKAVESLDTVQNACLRIATGALRTSPILPLLVDTDVLPLRLRRCDLSLRYALKLQGCDDHPCRSLIMDDAALHSVEADYMKRISGFPLYERIMDICDETGFELSTDIVLKHSSVPPWRLRKCTLLKLTTDPKGTIDALQIHCEFNDLRNRYTGYEFMYTDGAKTSAGVGCAFVHGELCQQFRLPAQCSVFTAEAVAILHAIIYTESTQIQRCVICTDSLSVVNALATSSPENPIIVEIIDTVHRLSELGSRITIAWIPGHSNIHGNEKADLNAKRAIALDDISDIPVGPKEYYPVIRRLVRAFFHKLWLESNPHTTLRHIKEQVEYWTSSLRANRREEIVLCRLRLGHTRYTHSYIIDQDLRPECDRCGCPITVTHILLECSVYAAARQPLVALCEEQGTQLCLKSLLGNAFPDIINGVFDFLRRCEIMKCL